MRPDHSCIHTSLSVVLLAVSAALGVRIVEFNRVSRSVLQSGGGTPSSQPASRPSTPILGHGSGLLKAKWTETRRDTVRWHVESRKVEVSRRERQTPTAGWSGQEQEIAVSFMPVDVAAHCDQPYFVTGYVPEDGSWVLQKWLIHEAPSTNTQGEYVPIADRRLPTIRMLQIWRGSDKTEIRSIESDPEGRFLMILTSEPALWKFTLSTGDWLKLYDGASLPALAQLMSIKVLQHVTEGRKYLLNPTSQTWRLTPAETPSSVYFLNDPDNDGIFDTPIEISKSQWNSAGYALSTSWGRVCQ